MNGRGTWVVASAVTTVALGPPATPNPPSHLIANGEITARVYLPDAKTGFDFVSK